MSSKKEILTRITKVISNVYRKIVENRLLIILLTVVAFYFFFYQAVYSLILEFLVKKIFSSGINSGFGDVLFASIFLGSVIYLTIQLTLSQRKITFNDFIFPIAISLVYLPHRFGFVFNQHWDLDELYYIYRANNFINTSVVKKANQGRVNSPSVAILISIGCIDSYGNKIV